MSDDPRNVFMTFTLESPSVQIQAIWPMDELSDENGLVFGRFLRAMILGLSGPIAVQEGPKGGH